MLRAAPSTRRSTPRSTSSRTSLRRSTASTSNRSSSTTSVRTSGACRTTCAMWTRGLQSCRNGPHRIWSGPPSTSLPLRMSSRGTASTPGISGRPSARTRASSCPSHPTATRAARTRSCPCTTKRCTPSASSWGSCSRTASRTARRACWRVAKCATPTPIRTAMHTSASPRWGRSTAAKCAISSCLSPRVSALRALATSPPSSGSASSTSCRSTLTWILGRTGTRTSSRT
mmetsp:Transcript_22217/g.68418  ORF Transcript_22217/g.68418 Transcript_22217/m.68418 type:complete len:230 (+) Transcript_22217:332-1021(+)